MKKILASLNRLNLSLLILGIVAISMFFSAFVTSFYPAISFEDLLDGVEIKAGSHIEGNVILSFSPFASETTETKNNSGSVTSKKASGNYYVIPMANDVFIGLKTNQEHVFDMDRLVDETYAYIDGGAEPTAKVFIQGMVKPMDEELVKYFREYMLNSDFTEAEIDSMGQPMFIEYTSFGDARIIFVIGVVLILTGIGLIYMKYRKISLSEQTIQSQEGQSGLEL